MTSKNTFGGDHPKIKFTSPGLSQDPVYESPGLAPPARYRNPGLYVKPKEHFVAECIVKLKQSQGDPPMVFAIGVSNPQTNDVLYIDVSAFTPNPKLYLDPIKNYTSRITYQGKPIEGKVFSFRVGDITFKNTRL